MDIIGVSKTHEIIIIAFLVAAAILLLIRQFYRMAKGKGSGCPSCSKGCTMKSDSTKPPAGEAKEPCQGEQKNENKNEKT